MKVSGKGKYTPKHYRKNPVKKHMDNFNPHKVEGDRKLREKRGYDKYKSWKDCESE